MDSVVFLVIKGLLCDLGSLSQELRLFKFDRPKTGSVRAKTCLIGQRDRRLPVSYLQPCSGKLSLFVCARGGGGGREGGIERQEKKRQIPLPVGMLNGRGGGGGW